MSQMSSSTPNLRGEEMALGRSPPEGGSAPAVHLLPPSGARFVAGSSPHPRVRHRVRHPATVQTPMPTVSRRLRYVQVGMEAVDIIREVRKLARATFWMTLIVIVLLIAILVVLVARH